MPIRYHVNDHIGHVCIDRPEKHNALTLQMYADLGIVFKKAEADKEVRVILITGAGDKAFCAGADLTESIPALAEGRFDISRWDDAHMKGPGHFKPVVSAINGLCFGGGFEIMLATDIRVAVEDAEFSLPEPTMGFVPAGGTLVRLARQVSYAHAMELMLTANRFSSKRLYEMGVINQVVPRDALMDAALVYAMRMASLGTTAMAVVKEAALTLGHLPFDEAFRREAKLGQRTFECAETQEGLQRFLTRRRNAEA